MSRTGSGLVVAEQGGDGAAIERNLRQLDPELRLVPGGIVNERVLWTVRAYQGPDRPSVLVLVWQDADGVPLPLSSRLLDEVQRHARGGRGDVKDADTLNRERQAREDKRAEAESEALTGDWLMKNGRPMLHRSQSLRRARDKRRARGEKI